MENDNEQQTTERQDGTSRTSRAASEGSDAPEAQVAAAGDATNGDASSGGATPGGAPKRRRRGKRGGKRHRKKTPAQRVPAEGEGEGEGEPSEPTVREPAEEKPKPARAPAKRTATRSGAARRPAAKAAEDKVAKAAEGTGEKEAGEAAGDKEPVAETAEATDPQTAAKKRRRRGKRGGRKKKPAAAPAEAGDAAEEEKADGKKEQKPAAKQGAKKGATSTRLAARGMRKDQRGRRRPRRLTEEDARKLRGGDKVMLIHEHGDRTQIGILEEGNLIEHYVSRKGEKTAMTGNVYLGKVQNVLPSMEAAFVDFGRGRNGVLYAGEVNYSPEDLEGEPPRIEKVLKSGQAIMVQVTKDPIGNKGARLTTQVSLAGRYMVLAPEQQLTGISRRLADKERARLRAILRDIRPNGHGVIVRTAAEGVSREALERDLQNLLKTWDSILKASKKAKAPALLYAEPELVSRVVRDIFSGEVRQIVVDDRTTFHDIRAYLEETAPDETEKVVLHEGPLPLFESYRVTEQLHKALERKVWLPSGGSLVVDRSEAMTVIDVNTGKFTGKGSNLEDTVFKNNVEAAEEVARQLRLRDIGGIIVIDFIDMIDPENQKEVLRTLKRALSRDKTRSQVFDVTALGLVEMTRKRISEGLLEAFSEPCPNCEGRGIVMTHEID